MSRTNSGRAGPDRELLRRAGELIREGRLVAFPTETVYGLGANALDPRAVRRIFEVKGRPSTSPLIVHVASIEMAKSLVAHWPQEAETLASHFWPGPLTLVLPKLPVVPDQVTAGLPTVGVRMPDHPLALALICEAGTPLAAPSANRFTEVSPTTTEHVRASLGDQVDLILDGGPTRVGIESAVLSLVEKPPRLFRPGIIPREAIENLIGPIQAGGRLENGSLGHPSPGLHPRHYSPRTPLFLMRDPHRLPAGRGVSVVWSRASGPGTASIRLPSNPAAYAAVLYETLHRLDREGWDWIAVEPVPESADWEAVSDRLSRAAGRG